MTLGERITYLRKERNLSQEGLGDLVGVSRQAVSKWEADRALPDVNNCVAMSRVFGITLAELLELEESVAGSERNGISPEMSDPDGSDSRDRNLERSDFVEGDVKTTELTTEQILIMEKMIDKYTAAQKKIRRRLRWPLILIGSLLIVGAVWLWQWLMAMDQTISYLHGEVAGLRSEIIDGVNDQLQASLREESSLVTNYGWEVVSADLQTNTITYEVTVNLKERSADTCVKLSARCEDQTIIAEMDTLGGLGYEGKITCPIVDGTVLYLLLENDEQSSNELLLEVHPESWYTIQIWNRGSTGNLKNMGVVTGATEVLNFAIDFEASRGLPQQIHIARLEVAVLCNDTVVATQPEDMSYAKPEESGGAWGVHKQIKIPITREMAAEGDCLTFELRLWDNYDRNFSYVLSQYQIQEDGTLTEIYNIE